MNLAISKAHLPLSSKHVPEAVTSTGQINTQTRTQIPQPPQAMQRIERTNMSLLHSQMGSKEQSLSQPKETDSMMMNSKEQLPVQPL